MIINWWGVRGVIRVSPCSTEPRGLGPGVLLGCLAGRAAIRSKIGIGIGNGGVVSWLGWPRGTRTSRDGVEDVGESSRLPQSLDYSFPQGVGLNPSLHRYPCRNT